MRDTENRPAAAAAATVTWNRNADRSRHQASAPAAPNTTNGTTNAVAVSSSRVPPSGGQSSAPPIHGRLAPELARHDTHRLPHAGGLLVGRGEVRHEIGQVAGADRLVDEHRQPAQAEYHGGRDRPRRHANC
jgi:hypothetical protein